MKRKKKKIEFPSLTKHSYRYIEICSLVVKSTNLSTVVLVVNLYCRDCMKLRQIKARCAATTMSLEFDLTVVLWHELLPSADSHKPEERQDKTSIDSCCN